MTQNVLDPKARIQRQNQVSQKNKPGFKLKKLTKLKEGGPKSQNKTKEPYSKTLRSFQAELSSQDGRRACGFTI